MTFAKTFCGGMAALVLALAAPVSVEPVRSAVFAPAGAVEGVAEGLVLAFKGLPYAAPPVGAGRWRPPTPAAPWTGIRDGAALVRPVSSRLRPSPQSTRSTLAPPARIASA